METHTSAAIRVFCGILLLFGISTALPQAAAAQSLRFIHEPQVIRLPHPGEPIQLEVKLSGLKSTGAVVEASFLRDGELFTATAEKIGFDNDSTPMVQFELSAPISEMKYSFELLLPDGTRTASQQYELQRECIPPLSLFETAERQGEVPLEELASDAVVLERLVAAEESAILVAEKLKELLNDS